MSTTSLQKRSSAGAITIKKFLKKFQAQLYLPKLARAILRFDASGELVADDNPFPFSLKAAAYTAVAGDKLAVNTTAGAITITLPASPTAGDTVEIIDAANTFDTNNLTVGRNGSNINSAGANLTVSTEGARVILVYIDATIGWKAMYLAAAADSLAVTNNVTVGGTLGVTGATTLAALAATTGAFSGLLSANGGLKGGVQALSGPGAVNLTTLVTKVTTTGADALTLADGTEGQVKLITMIVDGGDGTLTPTNFANGTTITFNDVNDTVLLAFIGTEWFVVANSGATVA